MMVSKPGLETREILLDVHDLTVEFRSRKRIHRAVNKLSFFIYKGETFGLVGETGCGKSLTGFSILNLLPNPGRISSGQIFFNGEDLLQMSEAEMRTIRGKKISMIFQDPSASLNPVFTVGDQILEIIRRHNHPKKKDAYRTALDLLAATELPEPERIMKAYPYELSGGMQQRAMIAMALCSDTELLIADEPTTALDVTIETQILRLLKKLQLERGLSILLITHNIGIVAEECERVGVLYAGSLVEVGSTKKIFKEMKHPYTQALFAAIPRPGSRGKPLLAIPGAVPSGENIPGCIFSNRCPFVMDICRVETPRMMEISPGHSVSCFLYTDGDSAPRGSDAS